MDIARTFIEYGQDLNRLYCRSQHLHHRHIQRHRHHHCHIDWLCYTSLSHCIVVASHLYIHFWGNFIFFMKNEDITFFSFHNHLLFFVKISSTMKNLIFLRKFPPPLSCWLAGSCFCRKYKRKEEIEPTYFKQCLKLFVTFSLTKMCSFQLTLYL